MSEPKLAYSEKLDEIEHQCESLTRARGFFGKQDEFTIHRLTHDIENQVAKLISSAPFFGYSAEMMLATACNDKTRLDRAYSDSCIYEVNESVDLNYAVGLRMTGHIMDAVKILEQMTFSSPPSLKALRNLIDAYQYLGMHEEYIEKLEPLIMRLNLTPLEENSISSKEVLRFFSHKSVSIEKLTEFNLFLDSFFCRNQVGNLTVQSETVSDEYEEWISHLVVFDEKHDPIKVSELNDLFLEELMDQEHLDEISDLVVTRFI